MSEFETIDPAAAYSEAAQQSLIGWIFNSLGLWYSLLLPFAAFIGFVVTLIVIVKGRGPMAVASILLFVHVPLLIGIFAAFQGTIRSFQVIANSATTPKPSELAEGISLALIAPWIAMLLMIPAYSTAAVGTFIRALASKSESSTET